ncbi:MAG TPA: TonB-dependent receptor [Luteibacter sp.]|jgi:outer membrane receptor protein involved in Fe transport|nr:TonB-dependent receptor [Luteibacter sp.]
MRRRHRSAPARRWRILWLVCVGSTAIAADGPQITTLPTVLVSPSSMPGPGIDPNHLPYQVQRVDASALKDSQATNVVGYLSGSLTGVNINDVQGSPFQSDITFHGYRASPTLGAGQGLSVYLDGVRMNEPFGDIVSWDVLPEAAIESLTLMPGANPLFGLNTLGGALVFTTKSGLTSPGFDADVSYGSYARRRVDLSYGVSNAQGWHFFGAGTYFDENGWRKQSAGHLGNVYLKAGRHTEANDWDVSLLAVDSKLVGNGLLPAQRYDGDAGTFANGLYERNRRDIYTAPDVTRNRVDQLSTHFTHRFSDEIALTALAYARRSRRDTVNGDVSDDYEDYVDDCGAGFDASGAPLDDDCGFTRDQGAALADSVFNTTRTRQNGEGAALNLTGNRGAHQWILGATFDRSTVSYSQYDEDALLDEANRVVYPIPGAERTFFSGVSGSTRAWSVFASDTWAVTPTTHITGSARWNAVHQDNTLSTDDGTQPAASHSYTKFDPALGLTQDIGHDITLFANASQSNRTPTVIELGCADPDAPCRLPTGLQADPDLKQVVTRAYEAGARWHGGAGMTLSGEIYRTDNRNDILFLRAPLSQQGYFANVGRTRSEGMDLDLGQHVGRLSWHLGYSLLLATYQSSGSLQAGERTIDLRPGMRIAGLPRHSGKLTVDWQATPAWSIGADMQVYSGTVTSGNEDGRIDDDLALRQDWGTAGYALVDLRTAYQPNDTWEFYLKVSNLFDRRYESYAQIADDDLPDGQLIRPQIAPGDAPTTRFVAPGTPRLFSAGVRLHF